MNEETFKKLQEHVAKLATSVEELLRMNMLLLKIMKDKDILPEALAKAIDKQIEEDKKLKEEKDNGKEE